MELYGNPVNKETKNSLSLFFFAAGLLGIFAVFIEGQTQAALADPIIASGYFINAAIGAACLYFGGRLSEYLAPDRVHVLRRFILLSVVFWPFFELALFLMGRGTNDLAGVVEIFVGAVFFCWYLLYSVKRLSRR